MFKVSEIKKWAKNHGISIKKTEKDSYVWFEDEKKDEVSEPAELSQIVKSIFNKISGNKFIEHQKNYKPQS